MKLSYLFPSIAFVFFLIFASSCGEGETPPTPLEPCEEHQIASGISILVKNEAGNSLEGVNIILNSSNGEHTGITSSNGIYSIRDIKAGFYEVRAERQGYIAKSENLHIDACEPEEKVEFVLQKGSFLSPAHLDFGNIDHQKSATINNFHSTEVNFSALTNRNWLSVYASEGSVDAHGTHSISIEIDRTLITTISTGIVTIQLTSKTGEPLGSDDITLSVRP